MLITRESKASAHGGVRSCGIGPPLYNGNVHGILWHTLRGGGGYA